MSKRFFDITLAFFGLLLLGVILLICFLIASVDTKSFGLFTQTRIGRYGVPFKIFKLKTLIDTTKKITPFGYFLRKSKIDELPQLWNVIIGDMSFVGPRPDIPGYYDLLDGEARKVLNLRPGITSEASIKYRNEELILAAVPDAQFYNDTVLFPDKVKMNLDYYHRQSLWLDIKILWRTIVH